MSSNTKTWRPSLFTSLSGLCCLASASIKTLPKVGPRRPWQMWGKSNWKINFYAKAQLSLLRQSWWQVVWSCLPDPWPRNLRIEVTCVPTYRLTLKQSKTKVRANWNTQDWSCTPTYWKQNVAIGNAPCTWQHCGVVEIWNESTQFNIHLLTTMFVWCCSLKSNNGDTTPAKRTKRVYVYIYIYGWIKGSIIAAIDANWMVFTNLEPRTKKKIMPNNTHYSIENQRQPKQLKKCQETNTT